MQTVNVAAYTSSNRTTELTHIDWGNMDAGTAKTVYAYLWSSSTVDLTITAGAWLPEDARDYLTLQYGVARLKILQDQTVPVNFTLIADPDAPATTFNFTITVSATESPQRWIAYYGEWSIYIDESAEPFYIATNPTTKEILVRANYSDLTADLEEIG